MIRNFILSISIILLAIPTLFAQVEEVPLTQNPIVEIAWKKHRLGEQARLTPSDTLDLPWLDDFSYDGPFPSTDNWCENQAFVNTTFGHQPPSLGVATFDGLGANGSPYVTNGAGDTLTSAPFYLGAYSESDQIYLSFYIQPKGNGDKPEVADYFAIEGLDINGEWIEIDQIPGISSATVPSDSIPPFALKAYPITNPDFLYDGFRFRFRNRSSGLGMIDNWHLDYVRMTRFFVPTENFNDIAFTKGPTTWLKNFTSMPWNQFDGFEPEEMHNEYTLGLYNHFPVIQEIQNRIYQVLDESGTPVLNTNYLQDSGAPIPFGNVNPGVPLEATKNIDGGDYNAFETNMQVYVPSGSTPRFTSIFTFEQTGQDVSFPSVFRNDTIRKTVVFDNYLSYDDGSAEGNVKAQNPGTQVAVKYYLNVADSLQSIRLHIPHIAGDATLQLFNLKVWTDLNAEPVYEANLQSPIYVDQFSENDTLQGFTNYALDDAIFLPAGEFYIGWQQVTATDTPIPIGFDKNNPDATQNNFFNAGGGWEPFPATFQGAIMIRPVLGNQPQYTTPTEEIELSDIQIFPNPTNGQIRLVSPSGNEIQGTVLITDLMGRNVLSQTYMNQMDLGHLPKGIFLIRIENESGDIIFTDKLILK